MVANNQQQPSEATTPAAPKMPIRLGHQDGKKRTTVEIKTGGRVYEVGIE